MSNKSETIQVPQIVEALKNETLVLFIGADLPRMVTGLPSRSDLALGMAGRYGVTQSASLAKVAARVGRSGSRYEFTDFLRSELNPTELEPQPFHQRITALVQNNQVKMIITTAYDDLLEAAFRDARLRYDRVVYGRDLAFTRPSRPVLIKLYGDIDQPDSLVVTDQDHSNLLRDRDREPLIDEVRRAFRNNTLLFLGYNLADPDFRFLFDEFSQNQFARTAFAVWPGLNEDDVQLWRDRGIVILERDPFAGQSDQQGLLIDDQGGIAGPTSIEVSAGFENQKQPQLEMAAIRQLLFDAFSDEELNTFSFDYFRPVHENFGSGMSKKDKIQALLEYCSRHGEIDRLLNLVKEENPYQYGRYVEQNQ